jgi:ribosomal protein S18 acetylase RimI-like enzyme
MIRDDDVLKLVAKDPLQALPVMGFFNNYKLEEVFRAAGLIMLTGTSDHNWVYFLGDNKQGLGSVLKQSSFSYRYYANVEQWMLPVFSKDFKLQWELKTLRYYLEENTAAHPPRYECQSIEASEAGYILEHSPYKKYTSLNYIKSQLQNDISSGIWIDNHLSGWALTHDDGSLGFLNILPQHRKKGLGEALVNSLVIKRKKEKKPVFVNIEPNNLPALKLVEKLGFSFDRITSWVKATRRIKV